MTKRNLLITVLILIAAASLGMNLFLHNQNRQQNQDRTMDIQKGVSARSNNAGPANTPNSPENPTGAPAAESPSSPTSGTTGTSGAASAPGVSSLEAEIEQKYTGLLQSVGSSYEARINSLLSSALIEYQAAKEANPGADITPLTERYYSAGKALEAECDGKMYAIMDDFENELRANSLPVAAALKARATYDAEKSSRADRFLSSQP